MGEFDAVVSTFDGFNYLQTDALGSTFTAIASRLRPGGWLVFDVHGEAAAAFLRDHLVIEGADGDRRFTLTSEVAPAGDRCSTTIDLVDSDPAHRSEEHTSELQSH